MSMKKLSYSLKDKMDEILVFDLETIAKLSIQLTMGLNRIHDLGFIHCDLKPQNIMIDENDNNLEVQIIDFGLCDKIMREGEHVEMRHDGQNEMNLTFQLLEGRWR